MRRVGLTLFLMAGLASAAEPDADIDALKLADEAPMSVERTRNWRGFAELAAERAGKRGAGAADFGSRLSLDFAYSGQLAPGVRTTLSNRLDVSRSGASTRDSINMLREAYVTLQATDTQLFDVGRVNPRYGVAAGYNPTDFFRDGTLRSITSSDPSSRRNNRLGTVMVRNQTLWSDSSLTVLYSPKLADHASEATFSPDLGATNNRDRWLISFSHPLADGYTPQYSAYFDGRSEPQLGVNLTGLANDATVAYFEWSGGRSRSLYSQAVNDGGDAAFRSRLAMGITYTTTSKISLTAEYEHNGAGLSEDAWKDLWRNNKMRYQQYRNHLATEQEMPTRQALFFYTTWQDAFVSRLDLSGMLRINLADDSRMFWTQANYHYDRTDLAVRWQLNKGRSGSEYGALLDKNVIQVVLTFFFS